MADQGIVAAAVKTLREAAACEGIYQGRAIACPNLTRAIDDLVTAIGEGSSVKILGAIHAVDGVVEVLAKQRADEKKPKARS
jgi:hypothetical protein